jgi:hypothetical protein
VIFIVEFSSWTRGTAGSVHLNGIGNQPCRTGEQMLYYGTTARDGATRAEIRHQRVSKL